MCRDRIFRGITVSLLVTGIVLSSAVSFAQANTNDVRPQPKPVIPDLSEKLSDNQTSSLERAFKEADRRNWKAARQWAQKLDSPVPDKIILWRYYLTETSGIDFEDIVRFIEANPDWPRRERLLLRAEETMPDNLRPERVIAWFAGQEPMTGQGKIHLAEAYLATGKQEFGEYWIQNAWTQNRLSTSLANKVATKYKSILRPEHHAARASRLLWDRQTSEAANLLPKMSKEDAAVIRARIDLINSGNINAATANVPKSRRDDGGLLYEQLKLHRRAERNSSALQVIRSAPKNGADLGDPEQWWIERNLLARRAIKEQQYEDAYEMVAHHGLEYGGSFADGEFLAGWLALRYLNDPNAAEEHFRKLDEGVGYPISKSRAAYWLGRALEAQRKMKLATEYYERAAELSTTFYGQLAIEKLHADKAQLVLPEYVSVTPSELEHIASREIIEALQLLHIADQEATLRTFVFHLADYLDTPEDYAALADLMFRQGRPELGVRTAKRASLKHVFLNDRAYPIDAIDDETIRKVKSPIELVLGLSRQESEFNPKAVSSAGALGLMQLMPGTAQIVAKQHKVSYSKARLTSDPSYNVYLGSAHLADLLRDWRGSYILTAASYNAGPHRAKTWIREYGDPRDSNKVDPIDWIEKIPFNETRNYVQRVIENMQVYRSRLAGRGSQLNISRDIGTQPPSTPLKIADTDTTDLGKINQKQTPAINSASEVEPTEAGGPLIQIADDQGPNVPAVTESIVEAAAPVMVEPELIYRADRPNPLPAQKLAANKKSTIIPEQKPTGSIR